MKKKILIIGATGFLGFHLAKKLALKNYKVLSISRNQVKHEKTIKNVKYLYVDITKKKLLHKILKKQKKIEYIINCGGEVNHKHSRKTLLSHYKGVKNLTDFFLNKKIKKFIQIGSSLEYGKIKSPHIETSYCKPLSMYSKAKLLATKHLLNLFIKNSFPVVILRLYQIYGPYQESNRFIPYVINNCIKNNKFPTSKGNQYRDFLYIDDLIELIFKIIRFKKCNYALFNVGYGKPLQLKKIIFLIKKITKAGFPIFGKIKLRKEEMLKSYPNLDRLKKIFNWRAKNTFQQGLIKTIKHYKKTVNI